MLNTLAQRVHSITTGGARLKQLSALINAGLPEPIVPALEFLITGHGDRETSKVTSRAENRRKEIAGQGEARLPILYSPRPGTAIPRLANAEGRPAPGETLQFTAERIAKTGKDARWGTALYLIAREFGSTVAVELGSCIGISAMYLASAPHITTLITVEGSKPLADLATETLAPFSKAKVVNALFDDAIDAELPRLGSQIDLAYIDGHHEKIATIHYFNKIRPFLKPGAVVMFDDVSWSQDMRDAWEHLSGQPAFSHAMDLGVIGVCVLSSPDSDAAPKYWDLQRIAEGHRVRIGDPAGWKA